MKYNLFEIYRGRKTLVMTDTYKKVKARKVRLGVSTKTSRTTGKNKREYVIEEAGDDDEKWQRPPTGRWNKPQYPQQV